MVKTVGPLLSTTAHGTLAKALTFSNKRTGQIARSYHRPRTPPSLNQWTQRHIIALLTAQWQCMSTDELGAWESAAAGSGEAIKGYHYFIREAQKDLCTHHGLVAYYPMNQRTGPVVEDVSGNKINLTMKPDASPDKIYFTPSIQTNYGNALRFAEKPYTAETAVVPKLLQPTRLSVEGWFTAQAGLIFVGSLTMLELNKTSGNGFVWVLRAGFYGHAQWLVAQSTGSSYVIIYGPTLKQDIPYLLQATYDNGIAKMYVNGAIVGTTGSSPNTINYTDADKLYSGSDSLITVDELRIYDRALGAAEFKKHYEILRLDKKRQPLLS